jgi:hypothetical protein
MITIKLMGTPACRRYQQMRDMVANEAERLGIPIELDEISDTEQLSQINPLSLPRLYIGDELVASQNPPKAQVLEQVLLSKL